MAYINYSKEDGFSYGEKPHENLFSDYEFDWFVSTINRGDECSIHLVEETADLDRYRDALEDGEFLDKVNISEELATDFFNWIWDLQGIIGTTY